VDPIRQISELIEPTVRDLGFEIVRVLMTGGQRPTLQVMVEPVERGPMTVEHCAAISHAISALLDVADPLGGTYRLEVSSPGIDRPLTRRRDFETYAGHEARLELKYPLDGRKRLRGTLRGLKGEDVVVEADLGPEQGRGEIAVPYMSIGEAKLVLTDDLIADDLKRRKAAGKSAAQTE